MSHELPFDREPDVECTKTDAVLARHLDGDLTSGQDAGQDAEQRDDGYAFACGETLHAHLCACTACQTMLRRARRLDAALAGVAGRSVADHVGGDASWQALQSRWFAAACAPAAARQPARVKPAHAAPLPRTPAMHVVAVAAVTAAAAASLVPLLWPRGECPTTPEPAVASAPVAAPEPVPAPEEVSAAAAANAVADAVESAAPTDAAHDEPALAPMRLAPMLLATDAVQLWRRRAEAAAETAAAEQAAPTIADLAATFTAAAAAPADRLAAGKALLAAARPAAPAPRAAYRAAIDALAACGDRDAAALQLQRDALGAAREAAYVTAQLAVRLAQLDAPSAIADRDDFAAIVVATRLHTRDLDAGVRRVVRRHPGTATVVAAALRSDARADGGAPLLLDLWHDLAVRGEVGDDEMVARTWFAGQPAATFDALAAELRTSRSEARRHRCLLALGEASDGRSLAVLLEHVRSPHHAEAHAAAFALAGLPRELLATAVPFAGEDADGAFLLRAALARAGLPAARQWLDALTLRPADVARVRGCTLAAFPEVASWFRERGAAAD